MRKEELIELCDTKWKQGYIAGVKEMQEEIIEIEKVSDFRWEENQKLKEENKRLQEMMITCNEKIDDLRRINKKLKTKLENTERKIREINQKCYEIENIESIISDLDNLSIELEE